MNNAVIYQAASLLLAYPDEDLIAHLPTIEQAVAGTGVAGCFTDLIGYLRTTPLGDVQAAYVTDFDFSRRHCLHLSYWTAGDTRRRGRELVAIKAAYRAAGFEVAGTELPDYLPAILELAAAEPAAGTALLIRLRPNIELLRISVTDDALPWAGVLAAVCATFPGKSPETRELVHQMLVATRTAEQVGIDLLPLEPIGG